MIKRTIIFLLIGLFIWPLFISANPLSNKVEIHGFISQGYLNSTHNNYLIMTEDGSFEFNEAAVNFTAQISNNLRVGLQLFSRDFGREGNNALILDWAYGDYNWKDHLGFRFGKIKLPLGLYNQGRDIDLLRTPILLPQGVYEERMRDFTLAQQGGSIYGNLFLNPIGSIEYEICGGTLNIIDPNSGFWRWTFLTFSDFIQYGEGSNGISIKISEPNITGKHLLGGSLKWNTPIEGLRLASSYITGKLDLSAKMETNILGTIVPLDLYINININRQSIFSAEYHRDNLQIIGEYLSYDYDADIYLSLLTNTPFDKMKFKPEGYYSQIDYRFLSWLVIGAYYSNFYTDRTDKKGLKMSDFKNPDYFGWQKDTSLTLRFDFSNYWLLKIEAHYIDGTAQVSKFNNAEGTRRYWNLYAIKTTFNF